ncbi:MAG: ATP-binding protein [Bacteroidetes bacterium]|nr:ATP-binding protein [Bacteroidota bacterium]
MEKIRLHLKNDIGDLGKMIKELDRISNLWGLSMKDTMNINLLLEEIVTNIVFYAYDDEKDHSIVLSFEKIGNQIRIEVKDDGKPFNILEAREPDIEGKSLNERKIGGLGIHFVRHFSDEIHYDRKNDENILTIIKLIQS